MRLRLGLLLMAPVLAMTPLLAHAGNLSTRLFRVSQLSIPNDKTGGVASGVNGQRSVVGWSYVTKPGYSQQAEIWRVGANGSETKRIDVPPPAGYDWSALTGINDRGVGAGYLVNRSGPGYVPAYEKAGKWKALKIRGSGRGGEANAIASDGVIAGWVNTSPMTTAAATFSPEPHGRYGPAKALPGVHGGNSPTATSAFSLKNLTVVGGSEYASSSGGNLQIPLIWVNNKGPYRVKTSDLACPGSLTGNYEVSGIFGVDKRSIMLVGAGCQDDSAYPPTSQDAFYALADLSKGSAKITTAKELPLSADIIEATASGIGPSAGGSNHFAVTGSATTEDSTSTAVWTGKLGSRPVFTSFTRLSGQNITSRGSSLCPSRSGTASNGLLTGTGECGSDQVPQVYKLGS